MPHCWRRCRRESARSRANPSPELTLAPTQSLTREPCRPRPRPHLHPRSRQARARGEIRGGGGDGGGRASARRAGDFTRVRCAPLPAHRGGRRGVGPLREPTRRAAREAARAERRAHVARHLLCTHPDGGRRRDHLQPDEQADGHCQREVLPLLRPLHGCRTRTRRTRTRRTWRTLHCTHTSTPAHLHAHQHDASCGSPSPHPQASRPSGACAPRPVPS